MRKRILLIIGVFMMLFSAVPGMAASKKSLLKKIQARTTEDVLKTWYTDFDYDGSKELFAVVGEDQGINTLWFASSKQVKSLPLHETAYYWLEGKGICKVSNKQKIFIMESGGMGSGSWSSCYYVKKGRVKTVAKAGEKLEQLKGKYFAIHPSAFDESTGEINIGHTWKRYYLKWTGTKFKEYKGKKISQKTLKKYKGAAAILKKAQAEGFSIGSIYKRDNGIINVNLYVQYPTSRNNDNLTLKIKGNKVSLVVVNKDWTYTWIGRYSYGGIYKASWF